MNSASVTLHFTASDSGSGVAYTEYSVNGSGVWTRGPAVTVAEQGVIPVLYRSVDNAGNTEATKTATVKMRGVALYAGADSSMSGTLKVTGPLLGSDPTAALYVNGKLSTGTSVDLSKVVQYVKAKGATVPPIAQFMPDARVTALTTASQVAPFNSSTPKKDVTYSGAQNVTVTTPMTVNGNLSITGSGTYTFDAVYVTGNVSISSSSAKFSFASLRVGGSLSVTGGTALQWGPTYVAGNTTLAGSGQWNVGLFVTAGNVAISGAQTMAGDGTGTNAKPAIFLMTGSGKSLSISGGATFYGLLCNRNGAISISSSSAVFKGSVLCGAAFSASGGSTIAFDPNVAASVYDVIAPTTTAAQSPAATAAGWNNSAVTVRLSAVDDPGGSGIAKTSYTVDGGATQTYASNTPPVISGAGTHPVTYWSTDKAGNVEGSKSLTIKIETTAPTGSVTINGGAPWTDSLAATLTLSASDAGSGVSQMRFSNDSSSWSSWQDFATSASWALASGADGTRTVFAQFSDKAGNVTAVTDTIGLDTTAPVVTISTPADGSVVTTSTPALSFTSTDAGGGVIAGSATMVLDSGTPVAPPANLTLADGAHSVTITVADSAGNKGSASASFTVSTDSTPPTTTATVSGTAAANGWYRGAVIVSLTATDVGSGVSATYYSIDGATTPSVYAVPFTVAGDAVHTISYWSTDNAGNTEAPPKAAEVKIDGIGPSLAPSKDPSGEWANGSVDVAANAVDALSGIDLVTWSYTKNGAFGESGSGESLQLTDEGVYLVTFTATDRAGSSACGEITVKIDATAPVTRDNAPPDWQSAAVTVTLTAEDDLSGVDKTWYKLDAGEWTVGTSVDVPADVKGEHTILYYSSDRATPANVEAAKSAKVYIGSSTPAISVSGYPTTGSGWTNQSVTLLFDVNPGASGFGGAEYKVDGGDWITVDRPLPPYTVEISPEGWHTVSYQLIGAAGNPTADGQCSFGIDRTPPVVTLRSLVDGSTTGYNRPALLFTPEDGAIGSGFDPQESAAQVTLDGHSFSAGSGYLFPTKLDDGEHTLRVTVSDLAGNEGSASSTFTTDAPAFTVQPETVYEGDVVGLYASDKPDVGNESGTQEGRTWQWSIARGADDPEPDTWAEGPVGYMVPDAATDYVVQLTVTDTTTHAESVTGKTIQVLPQAPRVHALDVDVLQGGSAELVARLLDPGWTDKHTAGWSIAGTPADATLTEDGVSAMESGYISGSTGTVQGDVGVRGGSLNVTDSDIDTPVTVPFNVNVVAPDPMRDEGNTGNGTFETATKLTSGQAHLSYIQSSGDIDIFEVRLANGTLDGADLPYGTEVLVTLRGLPRDYDLAVIQDLGADAAADADMQDAAFQESSFASAPHLRSSWDPSPHLRSPHLRSPHLRSPFYSLSLEDAPHLRSPHLRSPHLRSPYWQSGYIDTPHLRSPHLRSEIGDAPHLRSPFLFTPHLRSPHLRSPFDHMYFVQMGGTSANSLDGYSFADMSFTRQSDEGTSGTTIKAEELGFNNEQMAGKRLRFSATPGTATEVVLVTTDFVDGKTYVAVKGANGAFSETQPYTLQVETSTPLDVLSAANVPKDPLVTEGATSEVQMKVELPAEEKPLTLFVTQTERLKALSGQDGLDKVMTALQSACADDRVRGEVMSVPSLDFNGWDIEPWKPEVANAVTDEIRAKITDYLSDHNSVKYVVLVGSDEIIPQRRVQDETVLGNEREYVDGGAFLKWDSPLLASMWRQMVLTDDFYVDSEPIPFNEHALYIPDMAISRLVETPDEIAAQINVFLGKTPDGTADLRPAGQLDGSTGMVTGQDFMTNGVQRVQTTLQNAGLRFPSNAPLLDTWKADDVRNGLFKAARDVGSLNAHFSHFSGISAYGYNQMPADDSQTADSQWDAAEEITGTDITGTAADPTSFIGKLIFSMGCHTGLNVPDDQSREVGADYGVDPRLDIPEAVAKTGGVLVGSTGYGFGDTVTVTGTEALIGLFADQITATSSGDRQSIGLALAAAKQQYLGSLSTLTPYDEKSSIQFTMYGMPQYTLAAPAAPEQTTTGSVQKSATAKAVSAGLEQFDTARAASAAPEQTQPSGPTSTQQASGTCPPTFTVTIEEEGKAPRDVPADLVLNDAGANGEYVTANGDAQATADRPIQPRLVVDLGLSDVRITAARVTAGSYVELAPFDPAISCWTTEWEPNPVEVQVSTGGWWPADPVTLTTIETAGGYEQKLVILPGQFRATSASDAEVVTGIERVWTDLTVKLDRQPAGANVNDLLSPTVRSVSLAKLGDTVTAKVDASDASGISRVDVTHVGDGARSYFPFPDVVPGPEGTYDVQFNLPTVQADELAVVVDVMDGAGNVTTWTAKGAAETVPLPTVTYTLTYNAGPGGSITGTTPQTVDWGNDGTAVTATPEPGYHFTGWSDGVLTATRTDANVKADLNVTASFVDESTLLQVTTLAGSAGQLGSADGAGSAARFRGPVGVTCDAAGNIYVADTYNNTVRKITPAGDVTTLAGSAGESGSADGTGAAARFDLPQGIACDTAGNVYVGDWNSNTVRKIDPGGQVTTFAGSPGNPGSADGTGSAASFYNAGALACDAAGNVYVADFTGNTVRKITPAGVVTTLAGSAPSSGSDDGIGSTARFNCPQGIACDAAGNLYVADTYNNAVRKVTPAGEVTTLAGSPGIQGSADGTGSAARFYWPTGIACDAAGNVYVADYGNDTIRRITPSGVVTTVAGSVGVQGSADGTGSVASLSHPEGVACDAVGNLYIADFMNDTIRKAVCPATAGGFIRVIRSSGGTIALAGQTGAAPAAVPIQHGDVQAFTITPDADHHIVDVLVDGISQGPLATFYTFSDVTADHTITATFAADQVALTLTTVGQGSVAKAPDQAAYDPGSSVTLTANAGPGYVFSGWSGDASGSTSPLTVTMDSAKSVTATFVVDPATLLHVTTLAGSVGVSGGADGTGDASSFNRPAGLACDPAGNVYVADQSNHTIRRVTPAGVVTTVAGSAGETGSADGAGSAARFSFPQAVTCDAAGTVYVADYNNHTIRKITPAGAVTTFAGSPGLSGAVDATGTAARFANPSGVACDATGNVYVADFNNQTIRKITPAGVVTTMAGSPGFQGDIDGTGGAARLSLPSGVACDPDGNVYFTELTSCAVRKITPTGVVTTVAGSAGRSGSIDGVGSAARFNFPFAVTCDAAGNAYVADANNHTIRRVTPAGVVTTVAGTVGASSGNDGTGGAALFNNPWGIACDPVGNIYISDTGNFTIRKAVCPATVGGFIRVTQSSGGTISLAGQTGATSARVAVQHGHDQAFTITPDAHYQLVDVTVDGVSQGALTSYAFTGVTADHAITATFAVDQVVLSATTVGQGSVVRAPDQTTYDHGSSVQLTANADLGWQFSGWGGEASGTANPLTVTMDSAKNITATFIVDPATLLHVTTLAGSAGVPGADDGAGNAARFNYPDSPACDASGNIYVADGANKTIRKVTPAGVVTTVAGSAGQTGSTDGTGSAARFTFPTAVACDPDGNLYVADNQTIRKITAGGEVTTFAGLAGNPGSDDGTGSAARFTYPSGVACDSAGNVYVADTQNDTIRMITTAGVVSTLAGSPGVPGSADGQDGTALFNQPESVACDAFGSVYVADSSNHTIRKVTATGDVTTIAGLAGSYGSVDGIGGAARFWSPSGVACDASGNVYVVDAGSTIRKVTPAGRVTTVAGSLGNWGSVDGIGSTARFQAEGIACDAVGNLYIADTSNSTIRKAVCPAAVGGFIRVTQGSHGTISLTGDAGAAPAAVAVQHGDGKSFTITPDAHYHAVEVTVDGVSKGALTSYSFTSVAEDHTITASFEPDQVTLTVNSIGQGDVAKVPDHATYDYGSTVQLTANADPGWEFSSWGGDASGSANPKTATMDGDKTITAIFAVNMFAPYVGYSVSATSGEIAVADFSGDGAQDIAAISYETNTVSVLLGNGNGTLLPKQDYATAAGPQDIAAGDFNLDGHVDLAVAATDANHVSVLLGNGDGTLASHSDYLSGGWPYSIDVGDFNGDGKADVVTGNYYDDTVSVLLSNGDGTFQAKRDYATAQGPWDVAVGDFDGDGKPDLVTANIDADAVSILFGNGDGTFETKVDVTTATGPEGVAIGDFNGDGGQDLAVATDADCVSVLLGNGYGVFEDRVDYATGSGPVRVAVGDFDGDGRQDLAVSAYSDNAVEVLVGNGDGTFRVKSAYPVAANPWGVRAADLNADGIADIVAASWTTNAVSVLLNTCPVSPLTVTGPSGGENWPIGSVHAITWSPRQGGHVSVDLSRDNGANWETLFADTPNDGTEYWTVSGPTTGQALVRVSALGISDTSDACFTIASVTPPIAPRIVTPNGGDSWAVGSVQTITWTRGNGGPVTIELSRDNGANWEILHAATRNDGSQSCRLVNPATSQALIRISNASGTDTSSAAFSIVPSLFGTYVSYPVGSDSYSVASGDFNGDGKKDIVTANNSTRDVSVLMGNGDGTLQPKIDSVSLADYLNSVAVGDFSGDGKMDLATAVTFSQKVGVLLGNGDGTFGPVAYYGTSGVTWSVAVGDFNADGRLDLVTANDTNPSVSVLLGNGDGTFQTKADFGTGNVPLSVAVCDVNGDGKQDLVTANNTGNSVSVLLGNGNGTFQTKTDLATGGGPRSVAVADVNGDGKQDLVTANNTGNSVSVLLGNGNGTFQPKTDLAMGNGPYSVRVADFDGDSKMDIVTADYTGGSVSVLRGNGDGSFQPKSPFPAGSTSDVVVVDLNGDGKPDLATPGVSVLLNYSP